MKVKDLFEYRYGVNLELIRCEKSDESDAVNFVSRTSENNGVVARVKRIVDLDPQPAGTLSLATSGSVLSCFVQTEDYYSGRDLYVLKPKIDLSLEQMIFYAMCINKNAFRYSYGRAANKTFPEIEIPDLSICNGIIGKFEIKNIETKIKREKYDIKINEWGEFKVSQLFFTEKTRGGLSSLIDVDIGNIEVVSTTEKNNGVIGSFDVEPLYDNSITVSFNGACGFFSYHEGSFNANSDVGVLRSKFELNKYNALFLVSILNKMSFKYQYGRKLNGKRLGDEIISLPVSGGKPDFVYMENYIKKLNYSDLI